MRKVVLSVCVAGILFLGIVFLKPTLKAEDINDSSQILRKLDDVLNAQTEILKQLSEIKQELNIVKIRVTRFR